MAVGKPAPNSNSNSSSHSRNQNQNQSRKLVVAPVVTKAAVTREVAIRAVVAPVAELVVVAHPPSPRNRLSSSRQPEIQIAILRV